MGKKYEIEVFCFDEELGVGVETAYFSSNHFITAMYYLFSAKIKYDQASLYWR
jgi:hypothetical protein